MSWQIPTQIEQDIIAGKAQYQTFQTGNGGQSILTVPPNSYVVIFGYDFSPAGGGLVVNGAAFGASNNDYTNVSVLARWFETQQIAFYTGTDFYPFIHHVNIEHAAVPINWNATAPDNEFVTTIQNLWTIDNSPIARQVYITSTNDVTITVGLILAATQASANPIPVTNRTPLGLTFGGSGQVVSTQTDFGSAGTPQQFMQPSPKDYQDFAFGLLPNNADGQAFATPDNVNGLLDPSAFLATLGQQNTASTNYYLNLHYALYTETVPESRG
jgi:hypothetical protein